jgi:NAD(P)-dependent dehydrogenase (short-subunit alcohol dehydrogenase family)
MTPGAGPHLQDRVAIVTGAGAGIGEATVRRLVQAGARVALVDIDQPDLDRVMADLAPTAGDRLLCLSADVSQAEQMQAAYAQVQAHWGRLDIVFANAGINGVWAPIEELTVEEWRRTLETNLTGTFVTLKYAVPLMKARGGAMVVTASVNGTRMFSNSGLTAYSASKAGQVALAKMLALELARFRIRINIICPGYTLTSIAENTERRNLEGLRPEVQFPQGHIPLSGGQPASARQVADLVLFLVSDAASHMTGTEVWIDGGQSLLQG